MKTAIAAIVLALGAANLAPISIDAAQARVVSKRVVVHHGPMGHGCRTVVTVRRSHGRVVKMRRKICR
jgi:hypothetical protein